MRFVYLHGFSSSPDSGKAQLFRERLGSRGVELRVPDLNSPAFADLTISRVIESVEALIGEGSRGVIIGSSMGGLAAAAFAELYPERVEAMVLMAPAFNLAELIVDRFGRDAVEKWRAEGHALVEHYAFGTVERLAYGFLEDARRWSRLEPQIAREAGGGEARPGRRAEKAPLAAEPGAGGGDPVTPPRTPRIGCKTLILHGIHDEEVPVDVSRRVASANSEVELVTYDAGHRLDEVLEDVLERSMAFLAPWVEAASGGVER